MVMRIRSLLPSKKGIRKKRFKKAIKTTKVLNTVMYALAKEEKTNTAFVSALNITFQPRLPPAPVITPVLQPSVTISSATLQSAMPSTALKLQSILKNNWNIPMTSPDSVRNDGSLSQSEPNSHTIDLIVSSGHAVQASIYTTSGTDSVADPHTELDSHANMVVLGKHAYIFDSTEKTCNVKTY